MKRAFFRKGQGKGWGRRHHHGARVGALTLDQVAPGTDIAIQRICGQGPVRQRLLDFGFQPGRVVTMLRNAPMGDPIEIQVGDTFIALRRREAAHVEVRPADEQADDTTAAPSTDSAETPK